MSGRVHGGVVEIEELEQQLASQAGRCDPGLRQLARYHGRLDGDVLVLMMSGGQRQTLYRIHDPASMESLLAHLARKERTRVRVMRVDVEAQPDLAAKFRVQQVPTLVLVKRKRAVDRIAGRASAPAIESMLAQHLETPAVA